MFKKIITWLRMLISSNAGVFCKTEALSLDLTGEPLAIKQGFVYKIYISCSEENRSKVFFGNKAGIPIAKGSVFVLDAVVGGTNTMINTDEVFIYGEKGDKASLVVIK